VGAAPETKFLWPPFDGSGHREKLSQTGSLRLAARMKGHDDERLRERGPQLQRKLAGS